MSLPDQNLTDMVIKPVPVKKLYEFANTAEADSVRYEILPIDPIRAAAQSNNPVADDDDAGLMVAYVDGKCIGHQGLIPIELSLEGNRRKIIATVALFIAEEFRGKRTVEGWTVAEALYRKSLDLGFDVMNTGFGRARERLHDRRPEWFVQTKPLEFCLISLSVLQPLSSSIRKFKAGTGRLPLERIYDFAQTKLERPFTSAITNILGVKNDYKSNYRVISTDRLVPMSGNSAVKRSTIHLPRSLDTINWMTSTPWHPIGTNPYPRCFFCNPRQHFRYYSFQIFNGNDESVGYFVLSLSTENRFTTLKILDFDINDPALANLILYQTVQFGLKNSANLLECSRYFYPMIESNRILRRLTRIGERPYWFGLQPGSPLEGRLGDFEPDYCDGERPFL